VQAAMALPEPDAVRPSPDRRFFAAQVAILVFANWARPETPRALVRDLAGQVVADRRRRRRPRHHPGALVQPRPVEGDGDRRSGRRSRLAAPDHPELAFSAGVLGLTLVIARDQRELGQWFASSWGYAKQI